MEATTPPNPAGTVGSHQQRQDDKVVNDPTLMTIDALRREIAMMDSLVAARFEALEQLIAERVHRIDEALGRFEEQRREQKQDTKESVNAALNSQEQATTKMEKSISDQISALRSNFETAVGSLQGNIVDLKDRMTISESRDEGALAQRGEARQDRAGVYATIGLAVTIVLATLTIIAFFGGG